MVSIDPAAPASSPHPRLRGWVAGVVLIAAALVAYHNTFSVPFQFDDPQSIESNPSIRHLWPLIGPNAPLCPPPSGATVAGRPLVNLSLALNYAGGGVGVRGYHLFNLAIHALAGLALFGLLRRTLLRVSLGNGYGVPGRPAPLPATAAQPLAFAIALLWLVHPLQTEAVTYVVQRAESMMGLFYLLTLYAFVRAMDAPEARRSRGWWQAASVAACLAGMATKEVMISAPLLVLLYDRTFVAGTFAEAWRRRRGYYLALAATWLLLGALMWGVGNRNATAGFHTAMSPYVYLLTQCRALAIYGKLSFWPHPLVFDYGTETVQRLGAVWLYGLVIVALLAGTVYAIARRSWLGMAGAWFFAILAPSSSFVPIASQTMAEHRMYLPLAAVLTVAAVALYARLGRAAGLVAAGAVVGFVALTIQRNDLYQDDLAMWGDVIVKRPDNYRAYSDYGYCLSVRGRVTEAIPYYEKSLALKPDFPDAHNNLGYSLYMLDRLPEAIAHFQLVLQGLPYDPPANLNLANALVRLGRAQEALPHYRIALLNDQSAFVHSHYAGALLSLGRAAEAAAEYEAALRLEPRSAADWSGLGYADVLSNRPKDAVTACRRALDLSPNLADAHNHLGIALAQLGQAPEAIAEFEAALRCQPTFPDAHNNLGNMLLNAGRISEAIAQYESALQENPDYADAENNLGVALTRAGHPEAAAAHFEAAKRLNGQH